MQLNYTTQIQKGRLYLSKMEVGSSVRGVVTKIEQNDKQSKSGQSYKETVLIMQVQGFEQPVSVIAAGNAKFFVKDVADGKRQLNVMTTITRTEDVRLKNGMQASQFKIFQEGGAATQPAVTTTSHTMGNTVVTGNFPAAQPVEVAATQDELAQALAFIRAQATSKQTA